MIWQQIKEVSVSKRFLLVALVCTLLLIVAHMLDRENTYGWSIFAVWTVTFCGSLVFTLSHFNSRLLHKFFALLIKDRYIIGALLIFSALLRFVFITKYPYLALGDEIRDSALNAYKIYWGDTKDLFALGDYNGYGNFIPLTAYPFIRLLGNTVLAYRIPAALAGVIAVLLTYIIGRVHWGRAVGFAAAVFLSISVFHLHYSRVELLVVLDSLLGGVLILSYFAAGDRYGILLLGLMYGFALHFYAGIRGMMVILILFSLCAYFLRTMYSWTLSNLKEQMVVGVLSIFVFSAGLLIGLGPMVTILLDASTQRTGVAPVIYKQKEFLELQPQEKLPYLADLYKRSLLVYVSIPTTDEHISYHAPLLPVPVSIVFVVGVLVLLYEVVKKRDSRSALLVFILFVFPLTNEVSVNHVGADHRLMSVFPLLSVTAGVGSVWIARRLSFGYTRAVLGVFLIVCSFYSLRFYFIERPSDYLYQFRGGNDYKLQHILETAQTDGASGVYILNHPQYDYIFTQYAEKLTYFLIKKQSQIVNKHQFISALNEASRSKAHNTSFYMFDEDELLTSYRSTEYTVSCTPGLLPAYQCPLDVHTEYHYYRIYPK